MDRVPNNTRLHKAEHTWMGHVYFQVEWHPYLLGAQTHKVGNKITGNRQCHRLLLEDNGQKRDIIVLH